MFSTDKDYETVTSNLDITIMPKPLQKKFEALLFLEVTLNLDIVAEFLAPELY